MRIEAKLNNHETEHEHLIISISKFPFYKTFKPFIHLARKLRKDEPTEKLDQDTKKTARYYQKKDGKLPSISIITPTMDAREKIERSIKSARTQNYPDYEVIIINDDPRRTITTSADLTINNETNLGRSAARNKGARAATKELLVFLDANSTFKDLNTLRKIGIFYSQERERRTILKPRVLYDIERYETDRYLTSPTIPSIKKNCQDLWPDGYTSDIGFFWSDFFAVRKEQYERYPFDERFGKLWGFEDNDWIHGQLQDGAKLFLNKDIHCHQYTLEENQQPIVLIKKFVEGAINLRAYEKKWARQETHVQHMKHTYLIGDETDLQPYLSCEKRKLVAEIRKQNKRYRRISEWKKDMYVITHDYSIIERNALRRLTLLFTIYSYRYATKQQIGTVLKMFT